MVQISGVGADPLSCAGLRAIGALDGYAMGLIRWNVYGTPLLGSIVCGWQVAGPEGIDGYAGFTQQRALNLGLSLRSPFARS